MDKEIWNNKIQKEIIRIENENLQYKLRIMLLGESLINIDNQRGGFKFFSSSKEKS